MTEVATVTERPSVVRRAVHWNRTLMICAVAMAALAVVSLIGMFADPRVLTGQPIWTKPFKFGVSIAVYSLTLAWMISLLPRRSRIAGVSAVVVVATTGLEMVLIVMQVIRGTTSHFNQSTPFDSVVFNIMGFLIMTTFLAHLVLSVVVLRSRIPDRVAATAVRAGLLLAGLGMLLATPMLGPSNDPARVNPAGAHSVGVADGGPGLPVTGWSTAGGDYRIGHFAGLHGLQALPLLAIALGVLARRVRVLDDRARIGLLLVAALSYGVLTVLLTWQAGRGQPLLSPDATTLTAWAALAVATALGAAAVLAAARRRIGVPA